MEFYLAFQCTILCSMLLIKNKKNFFIFNFSLMSLFSACRSKFVGTDTEMYHNIFYTISNLPLDISIIDDKTRIELGHRTLMLLLNEIVNDGQIYVFVVSILTCFLFGKFLYETTDEENYKISVFMFFSIGYFVEICNALRQMLAVAIGCNSIPYFMKGKYKLAVLILLSSLLFHISNLLQIVVILFAVLFMNTLAKRNLSWIILFLGLCSVFIVSNLDNILDVFLSGLGEKYTYYLFNEYANTADTSLIKIVAIIGLVCWSLVYRYTIYDRRLIGIFMFMLLADISCMLLSSNFLGIFYRFHFAFFVGVCPFISILFRYMSNICKVLVYPIIILGGFVCLYRLLQIANDIEYSMFFM